MEDERRRVRGAHAGDRVTVGVRADRLAVAFTFEKPSQYDFMPTIVLV